MSKLGVVRSLSWARFAKRFMDVGVSSVGLVAGLPIILVVALLVRIFLGAPILFSQVRPGLHGRPFRMIKFRTMTNSVGPRGQLLSDAERLTSFGRFLRTSSLDELPELWNVLVGDMSLVGPRPLLLEYLPLYSEEQKRRHLVRPGVTGWAQVNGRNAISWEKKFELDVWYVDHQSLWLDAKILLMTIVRVFRADDVTQENQATIERFRGNQS